MKTKTYDMPEESPVMAAEPAMAYEIGRRQEVGDFIKSNETVCKSDRMSVVEYFDVVWNSYLKKHEAAQG